MRNERKKQNPYPYVRGAIHPNPTFDTAMRSLTRQPRSDDPPMPPLSEEQLERQQIGLEARLQRDAGLVSPQEFQEWKAYRDRFPSFRGTPIELLTKDRR